MKSWITAFFIFISAAALAQSYSGKGLYLLGSSPLSIARAGTGVASFGSELFYLNPASIAETERWALGIQYGSLAGGYSNPDISLVLPSAWGNFGASFRSFSISDGTDLSRAYAFNIGLGKELSRKLSVGLSADLLYGTDISSSPAAFLGGTAGAVYSLEGSYPGYGFGIFQPKIGFSATAGFPLADHTSYVNMNNITAGYSFTFYRHSLFSMGFYNDISLLNYYRDFPFKIGLESELFGHYTIRAGGILMNGYDFATFTAGAGYTFDTSTLAGSLNYSLAYDRHSKFVHHIGMTMEYGSLDRTAPETSVKPDLRFISPNNDGVKDYTTFDLHAFDRSRIKGWKLQIQDREGNVQREFKISDRDIAQTMSARDFFTNLFSKRASLTVPKSMVWNGKDSSGNTVPDGKYTYSFTAWDEHDNIAAAKSGIIVVDRQAPEIKLNTQTDMFSPNGDGKKDQFVITQQASSEPNDVWRAEFTDAESRAVRKYRWTGDTIPSRISWDGKNAAGKDLPEGLYTYTVRSADNSGNSVSASVREIVLTRSYQTADIRLEKPYMSYKIDSALHFYPTLSSIKGLKSYDLTVMDHDHSPVISIRGRSDLPGVITWNGLDAKGRKLEDGEYFIKFGTEFDSGNTPSSFEKKLIVDSTPPELSITHTPDLFSPDGDGENDSLTIKTDTREDFGIRDWKIEIRNPSGILFKTFSGTGPVPKHIRWNGLGDNKDIVESAVDYHMTLFAADKTGNTAESSPDRLPIDILVLVTERGLKMRISNIQFAFDSAQLRPQGTKILDRVAQILEKYRKYDVIVEGHTDNTGKEDYNLSLSERRAKSVFDYLITCGIDSNRLSFIGMGESVPLYPNTNEENRRRNRRVEFLLKKKD